MASFEPHSDILFVFEISIQIVKVPKLEFLLIIQPKLFSLALNKLDSAIQDGAGAYPQNGFF